MSVTESVVILSDDDDSNPSNVQTQQENQPAKRNIAVKRPSMPSQPQQPPAPYNKTKRDMENIQKTNFLSDFNPLNSRREKNKQFRNLYLTKQKPPTKKQSGNLYDDEGKLKATGEDICDCFDKKCEGCHFPCELCGSQKCGLRCRKNRRWMYEMIEYDGKDKVTHNPYLPKQ